MFPTLNYLLEYLFNVHLNLPLQTFGLFVAFAFWAAYQVFVAELKRYEANGKIHAFQKEVITGGHASFINLFLNFFIGFLAGFKLIGIITGFHNITSARSYLLSFQGSLPGGLCLGLILALWSYVDQEKKVLPKPLTINYIIYPYQLMPGIVLWVGFCGLSALNFLICWNIWII